MTDDLQPLILKAERSFTDSGTEYEIWLAAVTQQGARQRVRNYAMRNSRTRDVDVRLIEQTDIAFVDLPRNVDLENITTVFRGEAVAHT